MPPAVDSSCLDENEVLSLLRGTLDATRGGEAREHLDTCTDCQNLFAFLVASSKDPCGPWQPGGITALPPGTVIGRYRLREPVGAGAMSVVYLAHDEELGRKVALKMLRAQDENASQQLRREAQAVARVAHPNVIVVYEVGTFEAQVFMAMEFVEGESLTSWIAEGREPREVIDAFVQAGRGLAVAHAAGLVHRDFKPDNVLVGRDGRVRVVDFGLARAESAPRDETSGSSGSGPLATLTRPGALIGTPAYMSPEQHDGRPADARSDQFAFAVALYEALYGVRPFQADSFDALARAVKRGDVRPPTRSGVPPHVARVIRRGLSVRSEDRFPSMEALLRALERAPRRRGILVAGALLTVTAAAVGTLSERGSSARSDIGGPVAGPSAPPTPTPAASIDTRPPPESPVQPPTTRPLEVRPSPRPGRPRASAPASASASAAASTRKSPPPREDPPDPFDRRH